MRLPGACAPGVRPKLRALQKRYCLLASSWHCQAQQLAQHTRHPRQTRVLPAPVRADFTHRHVSCSETGLRLTLPAKISDPVAGFQSWGLHGQTQGQEHAASMVVHSARVLR